MMMLSLSPASWLHRWPIGLKFLGLGAATYLVFPLRDPWIFLGLIAGLGVLYLSLGRQACWQGLAMAKPLAVTLGIILLFHGFYSSFHDGFVVVLRILFLLMLANVVTMTSTLAQIIGLTQALLRPLSWLGINPRPLAIAVAMVLRFTPELISKGTKLREAWRSRSPKRAGWRLLLPFCLLALDDADRAAEALRARGGVSFRKKQRTL